jgi:hypothetical protein
MLQKEESGRHLKISVETFKTEKAENYTEIVEALISTYYVNDTSFSAFP